MKHRIPPLASLLSEFGQLKLVTRASFICDGSRRENSAEHSWHLALGILMLARDLGVEIDLAKALSMALIHDLCEIDAGDTPIYNARPDQHEAEKRCIERLVTRTNYLQS